jgi:hypothetical protein
MNLIIGNTSVIDQQWLHPEDQQESIDYFDIGKNIYIRMNANKQKIMKTLSSLFHSIFNQFRLWNQDREPNVIRIFNIESTVGGWDGN